MVAATKVKMGGSEEQVNRNKHSISSIKRVTGKYHVLVTQKKSVLQEQSFFFANYTIFVVVVFFNDLVVFTVSLALNDFIFCSRVNY